MNTDPAATPGAPPPAHTDQPNWAAFTRVAVIAAIVGWALFVVAGIANLGAAEGEAAKSAAKSRFMVGYLSGFTYWASLPLGAMALLMIRYVCKTSWGLLLTRPFEAATRTLPLLVVLWLPLAATVAFKDDKTHQAEFSPYWWSHSHHTEVPHPDLNPHAQDHPGDKREQTVKTGQLAMKKRIEERHEEEEKEIREAQYGFLSPMGYIAVGGVLFLIWGVMIGLLNKWGKETSEATDPAVVDRGLEKLQNISGPGLIVFAITTTASASQWVMSLEPGWSSTMFPVIFAVNQFLTCFAFCLSLFLLVAGRPPFAGHMRPKFQLDMATLMLVFTLFWSYTSFSQFMLVWIGNLPEEIPFYLKRSNYDGGRSGWWYVSAALIALHFALPFLLLLFRNIKMHPVRLRVVAVYLCLICAVDVVWWIAPSAQGHGFPAWLIDVGAVLGVGGVWGLFFIYQLRQRPLFPDNQAFLLPEGHHHDHH
ncbi:hypothetical protein [Frigoriglobus tundricola]|uniref:Uncharacterized protein n=1 Tax=Frigoriglobus tundricola TaxID=2774151 RepID=A0A6M5YJW2_9BACT|nr:hypothetical protein [Frigoriglobus tundricola]QJW93854.1 hypothetical protein FTUN_1366 [Frigoriglobus tundricola]